ncbi:MAG: helix-turn-helix domain-containing protein [Pseudomonadota bacterium]
MARKYNQECVLAYALDLLGERWTLLIVRELFLGPRRFGDLHACLPGIGTNLLSKRLKELEEADLILATAKGARGEYRLSESGEFLRPMVRELMYWSIEYFMKRPEPSEPRECIFSNDLTPDSVALALEMFANKHVLSNDNYVLHLSIDDAPYTYFFMANEMTARRGQDAPAVVKASCDVATLMQAMRGEIYIDDTISKITSTGDASTLKHFVTSITPGADVAFEVSELIKARQYEAQKPAGLRTPPEAQQSAKEPIKQPQEVS